MSAATTDQPTPTGDGPEVWPPLIDSLQEQSAKLSEREGAMLSLAYRLLLGRLQELLPTWTIRESADGGGLYGRGPAGESLAYSRPRARYQGGWLLLSHGQGWIRQGAYSPGEVAAEVADALGLTLSIRGDNNDKEVHMSELSFSAALELLKRGARVCRDAWNVKGWEEWIALTPGSTFPAGQARQGAAQQLAATLDHPDQLIEILPRIDRCGAGALLTVGWTPTTEDLLADDWRVLP